jgi:hypothetical protein
MMPMKKFDIAAIEAARRGWGSGGWGSAIHRVGAQSTIVRHWPDELRGLHLTNYMNLTIITKY